VKIAFDAQPLLDKAKTGIPWNSERIIGELLKDKSFGYQLNVFDWMGKREKAGEFDIYKNAGCRINSCKWLDGRIFYKLSLYLPVPYHWFFGRKADITQFFNYTVPAGVKTITFTYIYDMSYKRYPETIKKRGVQWLSRNLPSYCRRSLFLVTISEFSKSEIVKLLGISPGKIIVVPCAVNTDEFRPDYTKDEIRESREAYGIPEKYLFYLGTLEPRKNIPLILDAYKILKEDRVSPLPKLVLAGKKGWLYDGIFERVKENGMEQDVIFTGYVSEKDEPRIMAGAEIFLFPSLYEGFGMPPLEAMSCGTPVIVSNAASLPEVVGEAGLKVDVHDPKELADAIQRLHSDETLRKELSQKGIERAKEFTFEKAAVVLKNAYRKAVS